MLHGSETWGPNASDLHRLQRNNRAMIRWICGAKAGVHNSDELLHKLGINNITAVLRSGRLRWFGHVERAPSTSCIKTVREEKISPIKRHGRPRKTWSECVKTTLTRKTGNHGELVYDIAWCCQPHRMMIDDDDDDDDDDYLPV